MGRRDTPGALGGQMQINQRKADLVRLLVAFLDRDKSFTKDEIERYVRGNVKTEVLEEPGFSVDHLRVAMIDTGFMVRERDGTGYRVAESYLPPEEVDKRVIQKMADMLARMSERNAREAAATDDGLSRQFSEIRCEVCGATMHYSRYMKHCLKRHPTSPKWDELLDSCFVG